MNNCKQMACLASTVFLLSLFAICLHATFVYCSPLLTYSVKCSNSIFTSRFVLAYVCSTLKKGERSETGTSSVFEFVKY